MSAKGLAYGNIDTTSSDYRIFRVERGWPMRQKADKFTVAAPQFASQPVVAQSSASAQANAAGISAALQNITISIPGITPL